MYKKIKQQLKKNILIMVPCREDIRQHLEQSFRDECNFIYADKEKAHDFFCYADVVIGEPPVEWIVESKKIQWVQLTWAGADKYTRNANFPENVLLTNASGAFGVIISEYVIAGILALYKRFPQYIKNQSKAIWQDMGSQQSLCGKKTLILGTGDIGTNTAARLQAFGVTNIGIRRNVLHAAPHFDKIYGIDHLDELLPEMDIVVACLPWTGKTTNLMNEQRLRRMKDGSIFVNVGRGHLTNTSALVAVLSERSCMGAVLDVTEPEPLPTDCPLWHMDNVIITPHIAGSSFGHCRDTEETIWKICIENIERFLNGTELKNIVDINE